MRVIAGNLKHRLIEYPLDESHVRPTKDRVREAVFSSLGFSVTNAMVLDLFAGSGSYGIEAISRGAKWCTFNDTFNESIKCIKKNIKNLGITNFDIIQKDYLDALNSLSKQYDLIFLDPPYKDEIYSDVINFMKNKNLLKENAIFVLESDHVLNLDDLGTKARHYKYGKTYILILNI